MSALDAFLSTWSNARATFGEGTPQTGDSYDQSAPLGTLKSDLDEAAPGTHWAGGAATAYGGANTEHQRVIGELSGLDRRLGTHVNQSAQIVTAGRQDLDAVRRWVLDAAASLPKNQAGEQMLVPIVSRGLSRLSEVVTRRNGELNTIGAGIAALGSEYQALGNDQKFGARGDGEGEQPGDEDAEEGDPEDKTPAQQGEEDSEALQNGTLTDEQRQRLNENTTLSAEQQAALDGGNLTLPPQQMSYLQGFSQAFGDSTPAEIKAAMDNAGPEGARVADAFQLASNPNIKTGLPGSEPPSIDHPAGGGKYALPEGIQDVLDGPALTQPFSDPVYHDGQLVGLPEATGPLQPTPGLNDLADIIQQGNRDLQVGTDLDSALFAKSQEMLELSNQPTIPQVPGPDVAQVTDPPRWYHENVDPTLQNMFNAVNKDDMVIHDALVGPPQNGPFGEQTFLTPEGEKFLDNLTMHQWQDDGLAAGGLFDWVGETADHDINNRAAHTAHALAEFTSDHHEGLLNLPYTNGQSLGEVNPELTRDFARAFSPYYDDMVGRNLGGNDGTFAPLDPVGGQVEPENTRKLMSVLFSDQPPPGQPGGAQTASEILFDGSKGYIDNAIDRAALSAADPDVVDDTSAMRTAGRLQAAMDLGSYDEASDRLGDEFEARHSSWQLRSMLFDMSAVGAEAIPGGEPIAGAAEFGKEFVIGPEPVRGQPPNLSLPNTFPMETQMAEALVRAGVGDVSGLLPYVEGGSLLPPPEDGTGDFTTFQSSLQHYLETAVPNGGVDDLITTYWQTYSGAVVGSYPQK